MNRESNVLLESATNCLKFSSAGLGFRKYAYLQKTEKSTWNDFSTCLENFLKIRKSYYSYSETVCDFLNRSVILPYKMSSIQLSKVVKRQIENAIEEINKKRKIVYNNEEMAFKINNLKTLIVKNIQPETADIYTISELNSNTNTNTNLNTNMSPEIENSYITKRGELMDKISKIKIQISDNSQQLKNLETNNYIETEYEKLTHEVDENKKSSTNEYLEDLLNQVKSSEKIYEEKIAELEESKKNIGTFFFFYDNSSQHVISLIEFLKNKFSQLNFHYEAIPVNKIQSKGFFNSVSKIFTSNDDREYNLDYTFDLFNKETESINSDSRNIIYIFDKNNLKKDSFISYTSPHHYFHSFPTIKIFYLHNTIPIKETKRIDISSWLETQEHFLSVREKDNYIQSFLNILSVDMNDLNRKNEEVLLSKQNLEECRERYTTLEKYEKKYDEDKEKCSNILNEIKNENFAAIEKEIRDKKTKIINLKENLDNLKKSLGNYEKEFENNENELQSLWKNQTRLTKKNLANNLKISKENEKLQKYNEDLVKDLDSLIFYSNQFSIRLENLEIYLNTLTQNLKTFLVTENREILGKELKMAEEFKKIDEEEIYKHKYNLN